MGNTTATTSLSYFLAIRVLTRISTTLTLIYHLACSKSVIMLSPKKAWYLQHEQPPGPQLLYDFGLEIDDTFFSKTCPDPESLVAEYPPPIPKDLLYLPKFMLPHECCQLHLPLWFTATPPIPCPIHAAAARISVPQTPSDIIYSLGIDSTNMATIYMSPDPYFDIFIEPIN